MKEFNKFLSVCLVILLVAGISITAYAKGYSIAEGEIEVVADASGQMVYTDAVPEGKKDASPVISGSSDENSIQIYAVDGETAEVTLNNVSVTCADYSTLDLYPFDGTINLILQGDNQLIGKEGNGNDGLYIMGSGADQSAVSIQGNGSLTATAGAGATASPVTVIGAALSMDGGSLTANSPDYYGIALYDNSTLSVSESYLHPASVTAIGGAGCFEIDDTSQVIIGENNFVLDANGRDITAQVLADPSLLKTLKYVIIATKDIAVFPSGDMDNPVHMMTAYKNTKFEQPGEPSAQAMKLLSEGRNGEALYSGSFAFTDDIENHGKFQVNIVLPEYAGKHVTLVTLDDGVAVSYDRWVGNDGLIWCHIDHLGDFAVFAA